MASTRTRQPATPAVPFGTRRGPTRSMRVARRGTALVRMIVLIGLTGFLVAAVLATVLAGLVIAVNGRLP